MIALVVFTLFNLFQNKSTSTIYQAASYSDFLNAVETGDISDVTIQGQQITYHDRLGRHYSTFSPNDPTLIKSLTEKGYVSLLSPRKKRSRRYLALYYLGFL